MTRRLPRVALFGLLILSTGGHPLHTTLTEVSVAGAEVTITVRGFVDDLTLAATGRVTGVLSAASADSSIGTYLLGKLALTGPASVPVRLTWRSVRHQADVAWFSYTATMAGGLNGARIGNSALCELYDDQVNIVQVTIGGSRKSLLFTPGDHTKPIP